MLNEEYDKDSHQVTTKESLVLSPRGEESSVLFPRGEDGHQVTRTGNLWQSGGEAEQNKNEESEYAESVEVNAEVKEIEPPMTLRDIEAIIDTVHRQPQPKLAQQHRIQEDTTSGKGKPKSGEDGATSP